MKHISFDPRFVNAAGNDLISGKIHTIRQNYEYWKRYEGKEVALFTWEGKPYQPGSKQKVFCVKRIVSVQEIEFKKKAGMAPWFEINDEAYLGEDLSMIARNDGLDNKYSFMNWFTNPIYKSGKMAIIHFTDFRY